jgi:DNA-directed RNA polymerase specialized sigma24 family protein
MRSGQPAGTPDTASWFVENYARLLKAAWFLTGDKYLAEDIAQDASERILRAWPDPRKRDVIRSSPGYVYGIVRNAHSSYWKGRSRTNRSEVPLDAERDDREVKPDLELRMAIRQLPHEQFTIIYLRYIGLTIVEAGKAMELTRDEAYGLHSKAKRSLEDLLKD